VLPDMQELVREGVTTAAELEAAIVTEFNPTRIAFTDRLELEVRDVLNIGVHPR
jgi:lycopene cyclase CruP